MSFKVIEKEHIFQPEKFFPQCHASTLIKCKNGDILSAWFGGPYEDHPDCAIWLARKTSEKWTDPVKVADAEGIACWNPVLFQGRDETIFLFYKVGINPRSWHTMLTTSEDNGYTWSEAVELIPGDIGGRGPVKNKAIILSNGTWLAPASIETDTSWDAFADISKDQGKSWVKSNMVPIDHSKLNGKGIIQPTLWESEPGIVHMLLRSSEGFIFRSDSRDYGLTWSEAYMTSIPNNNSGIDLVKMDDGRLVLVYNPIKGNWGARTPIVCSVSADNGETWGENYILDHNENPENKVDGEFSYPAIISENNCVYITYTWRRRTVAYWKLMVD